MLYNTIRSRKTPITVRNKLNFIVRRWEFELIDLTWDYAVYRHRTGKVAKQPPSIG